MLAIDLVKISECLLKSLSKIGIKTGDFKYIEMYDEYKKLEGEGMKKEYIRTMLASKYKTSETTIFRVVSRLEKHVKI